MEKVFDKIIEFENNVLRAGFPEARLKSSSVFGQWEGIPCSFDGLISADGLFNGTSYQYSGENLLLHFTTFPVLSMIINSGFLRMSDFNCLDDINELMFASKAIWGDRKVEHLKEEKSKIFSLSACESNINTQQNRFLWKKYSSNGRGCAIEYKFSSLDIHNFNIGQIQYGKNKLKRIKNINKKALLFAKNNGELQINDFPSFLIRISSFHKDIKYKNEQEVRLLYYCDGGIGSDRPHLNEYRDFYKDHQVRNFIKIYLKGKNKFLPNNKLTEKEVLKNSPQIEIQRIFIGPDVSNIQETFCHLDFIRQENNQSFEIWRWDGKQSPYKIG